MKTRPRRTLVINSFSSCPRCGRQGGSCACRPVINPLNPFVVNHRDPELLLDEPAYNWGAIVEEQRTGRSPRQRPAPTAHYVGDCLPDPPAVFNYDKPDSSNADATGGGSVQMGDAEDDDYDNEPEPNTRRRAGGEKARDDFDFDDDLGAPGDASVMLDRALFRERATRQHKSYDQR